MTSLQIAKARTLSRPETNVQFRGPETNPDWEGLAVTIPPPSGLNGSRFGNIGGPGRFRAQTIALGGSTTRIDVESNPLVDFNQFKPSFLVGKKVRVFRVVNGVLQIIRYSEITGHGLDCWARLGGDDPITENRFELQIPGISRRVASLTFGVARIATDGDLGPVSKVTINTVSETHTVLTVVPSTRLGTDRALSGNRDAGLAAVESDAAGVVFFGAGGDVRAGHETE